MSMRFPSGEDVGKPCLGNPLPTSLTLAPIKIAGFPALDGVEENGRSIANNYREGALEQLFNLSFEVHDTDGLFRNLVAGSRLREVQLLPFFKDQQIAFGPAR